MQRKKAIGILFIFFMRGAHALIVFTCRSRRLTRSMSPGLLKIAKKQRSDKNATMVEFYRKISDQTLVREGDEGRRFQLALRVERKV
jgi:hypothetical protein